MTMFAGRSPDVCSFLHILDYCGLCGESYDEDNLARCTQCGRDYCFTV